MSGHMRAILFRLPGGPPRPDFWPHGSGLPRIASSLAFRISSAATAPPVPAGTLANAPLTVALNGAMDVSGTRNHMLVQTKFLRLRTPAALGDRIAGWRVCWLGGWDKGRVFYVVMVERGARAEVPERPIFPVANAHRQLNNGCHFVFLPIIRIGRSTSSSGG